MFLINFMLGFIIVLICSGFLVLWLLKLRAVWLLCMARRGWGCFLGFNLVVFRFKYFLSLDVIPQLKPQIRKPLGFQVHELWKLINT